MQDLHINKMKKRGKTLSLKLHSIGEVLKIC